MVDAARQMLDELMGRNRNLHPSEAGQAVNWEDPEFCQFYNVKFCPHDLFINTRADLGPCVRIHDEEAKHLYEEARPSQRKRHTEDEFLRFCNVMLHDVDRKIQKGKQRLQLMQRDHPPAPAQQQVAAKYEEQLGNLSGRINKLLAEAEEAGIRGDVDQAQDLMGICEELKEEREQLQQQYDASVKQLQHKQRTQLTTGATNASTTDTTPSSVDETLVMNNTAVVAAANPNAVTVSPNEALVSERIESPKALEENSTETTTAAMAASTTTTTTSTDDADNKSDAKTDGKTGANWSHEVPEKQMKVCEICGAFLIVGDAQQRIEDHLMGKQHLGYSKLRNAVAEINERRQKEREEDERRRRDDRVQRFHNNYDNRRSDQREHRERSRDYAPNNNNNSNNNSSTSSSNNNSRQSSDRRHHHHKSHHGHSYSRSGSHSSGSSSRSRHNHYRHDSRERHCRSRSRSRY